MAKKWNLQTELEKLDLSGRNEFYTSLLCQEIPFWIGDIYDGKKITTEEVSFFIKRRGFNMAEASKLRALAWFLNKHAKQICATESHVSKANRYIDGFQDGVKAGSNQPAKAQDLDVSNIYNRGLVDGIAVVKAAKQDFLCELQAIDENMPVSLAYKNVLKAKREISKKASF